jgi:hypothetical protein
LTDPSFIIDKELIDQRLRKRLSLAELFSLGLCVGMVGIFIWLQVLETYRSIDYANYINTVSGNFQYYFYAAWAVPFYHLFAWLPYYIGYALWNIVNIAGVFFAARVFGGKSTLALLSYQFLYSLFYGQITGIILGSIALFWWATAHKKWDLAGLGLILGATKFQVGMLLGGLLWLFAKISWRERFRILIVPVCVVVLSLFLYPGWVSQLYQRILLSPPNDFGSISLWRWLGPAMLVLLIPPCVLPLSKEKRIIGLIAAASLCLPYYQQADLVSLFIFPVGWLSILGYLGAFYSAFEWAALQSLLIIPIVAYLFAILPGIPWLIQSRKSQPSRD